jgi:hypothetical protein
MIPQALSLDFRSGSSVASLTKCTSSFCPTIFLPDVLSF